jgi:multidrug transporter EmrE-like cation transporter
MTYIILLLNIVLLVAGQTVWKIGLTKLGGLHSDNLLSVLLSPYILAGIIIYGVATVLWLAVLSRLPLSIAYPLQSAAYLLGIVVAALVFRETVPPHRWAGIVVVLVGIVMISWRS